VLWSLLDLALLLAAIALAVPAAYLALLSLLALPRSNGAVRLPGGLPRFAVLVPAHNEEQTIAGLLCSLDETNYRRDRWHAFVVADACSDRTTAIARAHGATVWERPGGGQGKGQALAWLLTRVLTGEWSFDAAVIIDADCAVSPNVFGAFAARLAAGARAVQADYRLTSSGTGSAALRALAFALHNSVRSLGRSRLGASVPLLGSGMCFSRALLERHGWRAFDLAEDREQGYALLRSGVRISFAPEARIHSTPPATLGTARSQHLRWERGRLRLLARLPALLAAAVRRRNPRLLDAALDALTPPLAVLGCAALAMLMAGLLLQDWPATALAGLAAGAVAVHVLAGMAALRASPATYRALFLAPAYALWKLALYAQAVITPGRRWVRTARTPGPATD